MPKKPKTVKLKAPKRVPAGRKKSEDEERSDRVLRSFRFDRSIIGICLAMAYQRNLHLTDYIEEAIVNQLNRDLKKSGKSLEEILVDNDAPPSLISSWISSLIRKTRRKIKKTSV